MVEFPPSRRMWRRVGIMYALSAPFVAITIVSMIDPMGGNRAISAIMLVVMLSLPMFHFAMRMSWARRLDAQGATTYSGRTYAWKDFQRIEMIKRRRWMSHRELVFATGRVIVPPVDMVTNPAELVDIIKELERGENRFTA